MGKQMVWVEIVPETGQILRILRTTFDAVRLPQERVRQVAKMVAVGDIRKQVIARDTRNGFIECRFCGARLLPGTGHMHEQQAKGKGGEVSVENSVMLCASCHIGRDGAHGDRFWNGRRD